MSRLVLVALAVAFLAVACKVDTTVSSTMHDDGSGVVTVSAVLDPDAVAGGRGGRREARGPGAPR